MGLRAEWAARAQARATARQPRPVRAGNNTWQRNAVHYPPAQPRRGVPIVNADALMTVPAIWRCVQTSADVAAGFALRSDVDPAGDPLGDLMTWDPIGQTGYTAQHLLRDTYVELQLHAMAFWEPVDWDEADRPTAVVPLDSEYSWPKRYPDGEVRVRSAGREYRPDELVWFQRGGRLGGVGAFSPVRFLARQAAESILGSEHAYHALVAGGATQGGIYWSTAQSISTDEADDWAKHIDAAGGGRTMRNMVLGDGLEAKPLGMTWAELQLLEARRYTAVETYAVWGMPPGLAGVSIDGASTTYRNLNMDLSLWDRLTLEPMTRCVTQTMSVWWDPMHAQSADLTRPSALERAKTHEIELRAGYRQKNEVREEEGWDPIAEMDQPAAPPPTAAGADGNGSGSDSQRVMIEEVLEELAAARG